MGQKAKQAILGQKAKNTQARDGPLHLITVGLLIILVLSTAIFFFAHKPKTSTAALPRSIPPRADAGLLGEHEIVEWFEQRGAQSFKMESHTVCSGTVHIIKDFLPPSRAQAWTSTLTDAWESTSKSPSEDSPWVYTTNDAGSNMKVRSNQDLEARHRAITTHFKSGAFSYSKWELIPSHSVYKATEALMAHSAVRKVLQTLTGEVLTEIPDFFVTNYAHGDFLSIHNDGNSGSMAWVINLSQDWRAQHGGQLQFFCGQDQGPAFVPVFNSLVMFRTRPPRNSRFRGDLPHMVMPVKRQGVPRLAVTGWYMTGDDHFSEAEREQNKLMKGNY